MPLVVIEVIWGSYWIKPMSTCCHKCEYPNLWVFSLSISLLISSNMSVCKALSLSGSILCTHTYIYLPWSLWIKGWLSYPFDYDKDYKYDNGDFWWWTTIMKLTRMMMHGAKSLDRAPFMVYSTTSLAQIFDAVPTPTCHIFVFFSGYLDTAYIFGENLSLPCNGLRWPKQQKTPSSIHQASR